VLAFSPNSQVQRSGLLLLNGIVYVGFGSNNDNGAWHGWIFSYNASTLNQINIFCTTPNGSGGGIWMAGAGLAAEIPSAAKPYGRMFVSVGNGSFAPASLSYGMSVLDLDLTGGTMTLEDEFTPYDEGTLDARDGDLGSGGPILLPTQTLSSGKILNPLIEVGKSGMIYILDRDNNNDGSNNPVTEYSPAGLGGFNSAGDHTVQEVQTPVFFGGVWGVGVWGTEAYWNNNIYYGGTDQGQSNSLSAYSFVNGVLSSSPTSQSTNVFGYPGPSPSVSANGTTNGIVWVLQTQAYSSGGPEVLLAYDASNLANLLYSSNTNLAQDNPGVAVRFTVPTIANGKVYVGAAGQLSVYGQLTAPVAATPLFSAPASSFSGSETVTITDITPGAQIYYTTDGTTPTVSSTLYSGPFNISSTVTITAIANAAGYLQSTAAAATFTALSSTANPGLSLAAGSYVGSQTLTITDSSNGAVIYYTFDGTTPTTSSNVYSQPISIPVSQTIQAIAVAPSLQPSSLVNATYTITPPYAISFPGGFANAQTSGLMQFNGSTDLDDFRLQLTDGGLKEAGSAFYTSPVNIQSFTTDFTFQLSNPVGDGMTFTIQGQGPSALGTNASGLGFAGIHNSVAIKFDLYNNAGQGSNSTGLYVQGHSPTLPSIDLTNTGIDLHSGDYMDVHITYDGTTLNMTITDEVTLATWSHAFTINIPKYVLANTAYVGFTASTGGIGAASQKVTYWTFLPGQPPVPNYPAGFDGKGLAWRGSIGMSGTNLVLSKGTSRFETSSAYYSIPVNIAAFTTVFDFTIAPGATATLGDGFSFVIQNTGPNAFGTSSGGLGYATIPQSVAIKFDVYNNAGEGTDSTGVYVNGTIPTTPSIDLSPTGVFLGSGDKIHAQIAYDGTTLTWTMTDTTLASNPSASNSLAIDIPATVGGNVAYIGFTAACGDGTAVQTIYDWSSH
jgi:hypothetical protein